MPVCIRCGREVETLVDGRLCPRCYVETRGLGEAPEELRLTVCPRCGSYRFQGEWMPPPPGGLEDVVAMLFQARFRPHPEVTHYRVEEVVLEKSYDGDYALVRVVGGLRGVEGEHEALYRVRLRVSHQLCPACFRRASGAPTAIVQIRGSGGRLGEDERRAVEELLASMGSGIAEAVISVDEVREGIDIKMMDQHVARTLASKLRSSLGAAVKESHKLIGQRRDGRRVYRLTLSVRLPFFTEGSLVSYRGRLARVEEIARGYVLVRPLGAERLHRLRVEDAWRLLEEPRYEDETDVVVAALEPGWIHLQETSGAYRYLELRRSEVTVEGEPRVGKNARLLRHNGRYYLLA